MSQSHFHSNGKLLLTGEYYVLEGAKALAIPTQFGQSLTVNTSNQYAPNPILTWKSYDVEGKTWLEAQFQIHDLQILTSKEKSTERLQQILQQARKQNPAFLSPSNNILVATHLQFARDWGLGSSSTLLSNLARWAEIDAFELLENTFGGSGYDIACAQVNHPILYQKKPKIQFQKANFHPPFQEQLYFIHLGKKQNSREGIRHFYQQDSQTHSSIIAQLDGITEQILEVKKLEDFEKLLEQHERVISDSLQLEEVKSLYFKDYWGAVKSLGAWGGDFVLASSNRKAKETFAYFKNKGFNTVLRYRDMVL